MKLYYTTAKITGSPQPYPHLSLGGYKSSSLVFNDVFDNFFGEISKMTIEKNQKEYIGLILTNDTGSEIADAGIYFVYPDDSYSIFKVGAVDLTNGYLQRIPDRFSQPVGVNFYEADGVVNTKSLGRLADGESIGIWLQRSLDEDQITEDQENLIYKESENDRVYVERELATEDSIQIVLTY